MLGPAKVSRRGELFLSSLEHRLPASNFYRQLDAKLDLSVVRDWVADKYAAIGRPSIDPVVFFRLQLIMFFEGLRSERKLVQMADLNIAHRWYLGYGWDEPLPDHSSLTRIRQRLGLATFQRLFEQVVDLCQAAGLVWGRELFFDGTKVRANADGDSLRPRFALAARQHVTELFAGDGAVTVATAAMETSAETPPAGDARAAPTPLPLELAPEAERELAAANQAQWKLLEQHRLDPQRPPSGAPSGYRRITDYRVSTTDPDATPLITGETLKLGYHDHYAVDGGTARIIVGVLVTPAEVQDNQAFLDVLDRARFRFHLHVKRAVADSKYATGENLRALAERGIRASMPVVEYRRASPFFQQRDFTYDLTTDTYRCPHGQTLRYRGVNRQQRVRKYYAPRATCAACPLRAQCTDSTQGRIVNRPFDEDHRERARELQTTEAYKKALRKRQVWVEPLFGEAKEWHQLRRFLLRGLANVTMQALLVATGQNLKRFLAAIRRGHRPVPAQRAVAVLPAICLLGRGIGRAVAARFSTGWAL
jgi:transposase